MKAQTTLFEETRIRMDQSLALTVDSIRSYGPRFPHWAIAWSGGKDSTALLTLVIHLMESRQIERPEHLTIFYADTRQELTPLWVSAQQTMKLLCSRGYDVQTVMAPMDKRFLVYMLGRGIPPPNNMTFRWCTRQIKVDPMQDALKRLYGDAGGRVLMLTGVRQGESAIRDGRIAMSCGRDGGECGQGWYQAMDGATCATLAPILHWRVCHVWDWLMFYAPAAEMGSWPTRLLADAYGGDEAEEINARTGCVGCPLAHKDTALDAILKLPQWAYLTPLRELRPIYRALREPSHRLRMPSGERRKDGTLVGNQNRMGPLTMEARRWALEEILGLQHMINTYADTHGRPRVDILNAEEETRIRELMAANTWPRKWDGSQPTGDLAYIDDRSQPDLFGELTCAST